MTDPLAITVNALAPLVAEGIRALIQSADGRAALDAQLARMRAADPGSPIGPRIDAAIAAAMARLDTQPPPPEPASADLVAALRRALGGVGLSEMDRVVVRALVERLEDA